MKDIKRIGPYASNAVRTLLNLANKSEVNTVTHAGEEQNPLITLARGQTIPSLMTEPEDTLWQKSPWSQRSATFRATGQVSKVTVEQYTGSLSSDDFIVYFTTGAQRMFTVVQNSQELEEIDRAELSRRRIVRQQALPVDCINVVNLLDRLIEKKRAGSEDTD